MRYLPMLLLLQGCTLEPIAPMLDGHDGDILEHEGGGAPDDGGAEDAASDMVTCGSPSDPCCGMGMRCVAGASCNATPDAGDRCSCDTGLATCGAVCAILYSDVLNCGACGVVCGPIWYGKPVCASGQCLTSPPDGG